MKLNIPDFTKARILVVGDLMLDRYWQGDTSRISPEAPVPVVRVGQCDDRPGGAGNVAVNILALGAAVCVDGFIGKDEAGESLTAILQGMGVTCAYQADETISTITKLRILSRHQQLIRLDFENGFTDQHYQALIERVTACVSKMDVVVLSDYAKGTLSHTHGSCAPELIRIARDAGKPVLVDPKGSDFSIYRGATLLTPNLAEFERVMGKCRDDEELVTKGESLREELGLDALLITRGDRGMSLLRGESGVLHIPVQAQEVYDVTGAGDTVIAMLAAALAAGEELEMATALANIAAGIVVGKLGAVPVTRTELHQKLVALSPDLKSTTAVMSEDDLLACVQQSREDGERIVMTNGCFDLLHAGHVSYLEQARQLGDRLIVAVNDDASVQGLKGAGRPINTLQRRMKVLAALECVDWVVPFSEDTPERLICRVLPDVLVKGGDYQPAEIAGNECVKNNGGDVIVLAYEEGCSSSDLIASIKEKA